MTQSTSEGMKRNLCPVCGKYLPAGEGILYFRDAREVVHLECVHEERLDTNDKG
jgi:hypothetical protein